METAALENAKEQLDKLGAVLPHGGGVLIFAHDYPDPDALASAMALHLLLKKRFRVHGRIVFSGMVSRAENKELLRHCQYHWHLLSQVRPPARRIPAFFVDTAPWSGNVTVPAFARPVGVIDHHPFKQKRVSPDLFADIRPGAGATASILCEYLCVADIQVPKWLASVMTYAITTETLDFSRNTTPLDLEAYSAMVSRANMAAVGQMRHAPLPRVYYAQLQEALKNAFVYGRVAWAHLDSVQQPEIVPEIADLLCRMERVTWAFCTAYVDENMIVSLRSDQKGARCATLLKRLVRGNGSVGGHHQMAAGYLSMAGLAPREREERREAFVKGLVQGIERRSPSGEDLEDAAKPLTEPPPSAT